MKNRKAVEAYRRRRTQRLRARYDADEENNGNQNGGSHGNTRIPFGLCQREGIDIKDGWTPRDAWKALEGKGYSASETYSELKKTGKIAPKQTKEKKLAPKFKVAEIEDISKERKSKRETYGGLRNDSVTAHNDYQKAIDGVVEAIMRRADVERDIAVHDRMKTEDNWWYMKREQLNQELESRTEAQKKATEKREKAKENVEKADERLKAFGNEVAEADKKYREAVDDYLDNTEIGKRLKQHVGAEEEMRIESKKNKSLEDRLTTANNLIRYWEKEIEKDENTLKSAGISTTARENLERSIQRAKEKISGFQEEIKKCEPLKRDSDKKIAEIEKRLKEAKDGLSEEQKREWEKDEEMLSEANTVQDGPYDKLSDHAAGMRLNKVAYLNPKRFVSTPSDEDIIDRLGGGDKTTGSCASLGFAYIANKAGYDVLDFRGGNSRGEVSVGCNGMIESLGGIIERDFNDFRAVNRLLATVEEGKEYYLSTGSHASIIRKRDGKFEFLELQSYSENGWKPLTTDRLQRRFGCRKTHSSVGTKYEAKSGIIEASKLAESEEFISYMGYINTAEDKQKKGAGGGVK